MISQPTRVCLRRPACERVPVYCLTTHIAAVPCRSSYLGTSTRQALQPPQTGGVALENETHAKGGLRQKAGGGSSLVLHLPLAYNGRI